MELSFLKDTVTIDPGLGTGICYWTGDNDPYCYGITEPATHKSKSMFKRLSFLFESFTVVMDDILNYGSEIVYAGIEGVSYWSGSSKSHASVSSGDAFFEAYLLGGYVEILSRRCKNILILTPQEWKAQMPKNVTNDRVRDLLDINTNGMTEHTLDAIALGLSISGHLDPRKKRINELYEKAESDDRQKRKKRLAPKFSTDVSRMFKPSLG